MFKNTRTRFVIGAASIFMASTLVSSPVRASDASAMLPEARLPDVAVAFDLEHAWQPESGDEHHPDESDAIELHDETSGELHLFESSHGFGRAGSTWLTFGGGYANDLDDDQSFNAYIAWSKFLADEFEFAVELGGWYFDQVGHNTGGLNGNMVFRWHMFHDEEFSWSAYGDIGIGLLLGFDTVPDGGTGFNFTPRAGFGITKQLADDGTRLQLGFRWHHISNGRIEGDIRNPSRDSLMFYAGVQIPF